MDLEETDILSSQDGNRGLVHYDESDTSNSNLTLIGSNENLLLPHESQSTIEPFEDVELSHDVPNALAFTDDDAKSTQVINSNNYGKSEMLHCESIQSKSVLSSSAENLTVNQLGYKIANLHLPACDFEPSNFSSKNVVQMNIFENDNKSVCTEESSTREFLDVKESNSSVHSFCDTDSLKTCLNDDSNILNESDLTRNELKKCCLKEDAGKNQIELKHSSEIKERVMSYLNKHSGSYESLDEEQMCNKVLVKEDKCKINSDLGLKNSSLKNVKEDIVSSSSSSTVAWEPMSPIQNSQAEELSSVVVTDIPCIPRNGKTVPLISVSDISTPTSSAEVLSVCSKNETVINNCSSSNQCCIENSSNKMEVNDSIDTTNDSIPDSFINTPLNETISCESEMQLTPHSNASCNSICQFGAVASTYFLDCQDTVLLGKGANTSQFGKQRQVAPIENSNSLVDQPVLPFYDKSGTVANNPPLSSWGKLSFQSFTTPSIKSPILSSKSNIEEKQANPVSMALCTPMSNYKCEIDESSPQNTSKDELNSRKTKSTEALFSNMFFTTSTDTIFNDNIGGKSSSKISNLHFVSPIVHTESSWSENSLRKNIKFETEKSFSDSFSTADSKIVSSSSFGCVANGPFNRISENPFSKRISESIGIFNSHQETGFSGFSKVSKPVATIFSPKREKITEENSNFSGDPTQNLSDTNKETTEFGIKSNCENQQVLSCVSPKFFFKCTEQSSDTKKFAFNPGNQNATEGKHMVVRIPKEPEYLNHSKAQTTTSLSSINSLFHFKVNGEKSKTSNSHRFSCTRLSRKPTKLYRQNDKGFSKFTKEESVFNSSINSLPNAPFKPAHGSDVVWDKTSWHTKNVTVRYQNIVFMKEHLNISPDELRLQYYNKTRVTGPFKFCASAENNECHSYKKVQSKEVQTDENLISKRYELSEIWRALECPVCLDVVMPPVYQCEQGHHACLTCWNKVVTCPLCKRHKSVTRNYMAEALIDQIPLPCKYHIEGCKETVCRANKVSHEETCPYRMYQCPVPSCNQAHSYQNMCTHFKKVHKSLLHHEGHSVGKGEKFCDVLYKELLSSSLIHAFDIAKWGLFFLREVVTKHSKALFVQVMPASPEPAAYFYHLEVCDHHDCRKECYKGRVFSMGKPIQEILDEEEYLSLSVLILKTVKKSAPLKIIVTIWQLKPAFTLSTE